MTPTIIAIVASVRPRAEIATRMETPIIMSRGVGLGIVLAAVLTRGVAAVYWADLSFNADDATSGLMAKHLSEGRAFPVMQYGLQYVLVLESWFAAPLMWIKNDSPALLALVPVSLN